MNRAEFFYLLPYLLSLVISLAVFLYTWQHRHVRGASSYVWFVAGQTLTILGFILELLSPDLQTKILWDKFQWLTDSFLVFIPFLIFSVQFSEHKLRNPRLTWGYWISVPILFTLFLLTDSIHHLLYPNPHLRADFPFPELQYDFTIVVYLYALLYVYGANFYGIALLIRRAIQPHNTYRKQYWTIAIGFLIPLILSFFTLANIRIAPYRDIAPFSFAIGNLIVAWGLFRYGLFNIVPIARERIVENLRDPVFVLDTRNRVLDLNVAALKMLRMDASKVIGRHSKEVFAKWPVIVSELEYLDVERREIAIQEDGDTFYYDVNISSIYNNYRQLLGRIVAARDITRYKTLESGYRLLSGELEERVRERTDELRKSAERYRAVVENQTEFIVSWKSDGTRTFANEAYCRYFGITLEQALSTSFMPLIAEEDRQMVEEKMSRLISGEVRIETFTHRVIKPDGSIGWQEWTDQAIYDESGRIIEFQSVGRDITARRQAEEALRKSESIYRKAIEVAGGVPYRQSYRYYEGYHLHMTYDFIGEGIRQLTGYGPEEFTEDLWDSLVKESILTGELSKYSWREAIQRVRNGSSPVWQCEHRIQTRNRESRWVYEVAVELREKDGLSHGSIGLLQDITTRKQAEDDLRESEERFAILSTATFEAICLTTHGKIIDANEQMLAMFGYQRSEIIGLHVEKLVAPESIELVKRNIAANMEEPYEHLAIKKDGTIFSVEVRPRTIPYKGQSVRVTAIRDITERRQAEEALRISEERFSKAFHASPIIITISQIHSGKLLEVNEAFEKVMGFSREQVIGKTAAELKLWVNPVDREQIMQKFMTYGELRNEELQFRTRQGEIIICNYSAELIELGGEKCALAIVEDITERKKSEARILRLNRLYVTISQINQTIVHARDKESLFSEICRVATEHGQFRMAWIGLVEKADDLVKPVIFAGVEDGYLAKVKIHLNDMILGRGPTGTAIREGRCIICQDISSDPRMLPWREHALPRGYRSSAAVPLREKGHVVGALTVYATEPQGFDTEDEALLEQIGLDVSFALDSIDAEIRREHAEANLAESYDTTLEGWAKALELRDKETEGHSRRVTEATVAVARAMGFNEPELIHVRRGSILHDIGKMGIPDDILRKNGPLTDEERVVVQRHPRTAYELLRPIYYLESALEIPYCHHEKWDGSGYPRGLKGEEIPLAARIFAVVDVWDALSSDRPYRKAWPREKVAEYLIAETRKHFDPQVMDVFLQMMDKGEI